MKTLFDRMRPHAKAIEEAATANDAEEAAFTKGAWFAFGEVLSWINTQATMTINKKDMYRAVMEMRPRSIARHYKGDT